MAGSCGGTARRWGFAVPDLYDFCEQAEITNTIGLIPNPRLEWLVIPLEVAAQYRRDLTGETTVRFVSETAYQAGIWERARRVVYIAEGMEQGQTRA